AELATEARAAGLALVRFVAPTTSPERLALILGAATGFVYVVSLTGVTGARERLEENLEALVTQVRAKSALPVAVGFGVSTPAQAAAVGRFADGVIVGSALIDAYTSAGNDPRAAANFAQAMRVALAVGRQPSSIRGLAT
ncbi:MAG: tryptophan synthase subunit alpha, partial [Candidatus Promineifilaceae bacterium]